MTEQLSAGVELERYSVRVRVDLAYDGGAYHGWAAQPGLATVEGVLKEGLRTLIRRDVSVVVAGRTDAGVHARGQVIHLDLTPTEWEGLSRGRQITPEEALYRRLNGVLAAQQGGVVVHGVRRVSAAFDARFSALSRRYTYRLADGVVRQDPLRRADTAWHPAELDVCAMDAEASSLGGLADFGSFCKPREHGTTLRELTTFAICRAGDDVISATLEADAFCHHMVRALIGACIDVGQGRRRPGWLAQRLREPSWDSHVRLAAPRGLVLEAVTYPADEQLAARATQTRARRT